MNLGANIQYLRKLNKLTQEQFAEKMGITRQTVSRWESDEVTPELNKLVEMCSLFSCKLDALVREDMSSSNAIYSEVEIRKVPAFKMARYVMITPNPEADVQYYMKKWAQKSGLAEADPKAKLIGWDFPFVSQELQTRFNLHGYVAAYVLPEGFQTDCPGVEYAQNKEADLQANHFKEKLCDDIICCFEHEYEKDGIVYLDIYVHTDSVAKVDAHSDFD